MLVFWVVTPYGLVGTYQHFVETYCLYLQEKSAEYCCPTVTFKKVSFWKSCFIHPITYCPPQCVCGPHSLACEQCQMKQMYRKNILCASGSQTFHCGTSQKQFEYDTEMCTE
jgi:hypothetical protein